MWQKSTRVRTKVVYVQTPITDEVEIGRRISAYRARFNLHFQDETLYEKILNPTTWRQMAIVGDSVQKTILAVQYAEAFSAEEQRGRFWEREIVQPLLKNDTLAEVAMRENFNQYIICRPRDRYDTQGREITIHDLGDMLEALLGAMFFDTRAGDQVDRTMSELGLELLGIHAPEETRTQTIAAIARRLREDESRMLSIWRGYSFWSGLSQNRMTAHRVFSTVGWYRWIGPMMILLGLGW